MFDPNSTQLNMNLLSSCCTPMTVLDGWWNKHSVNSQATFGNYTATLIAAFFQSYSHWRSSFVHCAHVCAHVCMCKYTEKQKVTHWLSFLSARLCVKEFAGIISLEWSQWPHELAIIVTPFYRYYNKWKDIKDITITRNLCSKRLNKCPRLCNF